MTTLDAVIFDLDGVITRTALVHSAAWKQAFDAELREREARGGEPFREFTHEGDYLTYVDGKPRQEGVASFLASRGIELPLGEPDDPPERETIWGIGNRKNLAFAEILERDGAEVFDSSVALIDELIAAGVRVGVASSSKNCRAVLRVTGLLEKMETIIDGVESAARGLRGKPAPDIFTTAADELGAPYDRCVVVEDAVSGVTAGRRANFGLVLGVAREKNHQALRAAGADLTVDDLGEVDLARLRRWFDQELEEDGWVLRYPVVEPSLEKHRETLLSVGNGYLGTRGAAEESRAGEHHYPGTYIAGVYDRATSVVNGREVENEDLVNCLNWLPMTFRIDTGPWTEVDADAVVELDRSLDLRSGRLRRRMVLEGSHGREVLVESERLVSMSEPHLAALSYRITLLGGRAGEVEVRAGLDGALINDNVARYRSLEQRHLRPIDAGSDEGGIHLLVQTLRSQISIGAAARIDVCLEGRRMTPPVHISAGGGQVSATLEQWLEPGQTLRVDKIVAIHTSRDVDVPLDASRQLRAGAGSFDQLAAQSAEAWAALWHELDVGVEGDRLAQKLIRLHLYHLMLSASPHSVGLDASITARGLHGEAYRGHVFWDELFILPLYAMHLPEVSRELLMYRYRRLGQARRAAEAEGFRGAMFPWQSGSDGREETQTVHYNPLSGAWDPDHSRLQRHVSLAVAFDVWQHARLTGDEAFLEAEGGEMLLEICRFWVSLAELNQELERYEIRGVMGPDEFHEKMPGASEGGLVNNAYTNLMVVWILRRALELVDQLEPEARARLTGTVGLGDEELERWRDVAARMAIPLGDDGLLEQFEGYSELEEIDWEDYRARYGDVHRMDRILKAEGKSPDDYKVSKQADALMLFYNLPLAEVEELVRSLGYEVDQDFTRRNLEVHLRHTSHGSTLSRIVHAQLAAEVGDRELSWKMFRDALTSDYEDIQGGTTAEGIHTGVMASTVLVLLRAYLGLELDHQGLRLSPRLPPGWRRVRFGVRLRGTRYDLTVAPGARAAAEER